ncbi:MAG: hypothetical protein EOO01_43645 [Chitinophagaceae bacterium]|nr:MAG: hypothetical protein EOO01_43645 [Chitinophagaceae bacterium]
MKTIFLFFLITFVSYNVSSQTAYNPKTGEPFNKVEREAVYKYGKKVWQEFLKNNINLNVPMRNGAPAGVYRVLISFIVDKNGNIGEIQADSRHGYGMEEEVIRVLLKSGKWKPAQQGGKNVNAYRRQPITFVVDYGGEKKRT